MVRGFDSDSKKTINSYKYPLKNQEDEVIIQIRLIKTSSLLTKRNGINRFRNLSKFTIC
jgi:hypothetical protein